MTILEIIDEEARVSERQYDEAYHLAHEAVLRMGAGSYTLIQLESMIRSAHPDISETIAMLAADSVLNP